MACSLMASFMSAITLLGVSQETYTHGAQVSTESLPPLQTCSYPPPAPATASAPVAAPLVCNDKPVVPGGHPRGLPRVPASFPQSADDQCLQVAASLHPVLSPPPQLFRAQVRCDDQAAGQSDFYYSDGSIHGSVHIQYCH